MRVACVWLPVALCACLIVHFTTISCAEQTEETKDCIQCDHNNPCPFGCECIDGCCECYEDVDRNDGEDPRHDEDNPDDPYDPCDDNAAPTLESVEIHYDTNGDGDIDGIVEGPPYEWEDNDFKQYIVGFAYNDDDCNLPGGEVWYELRIDGVSDGWQKSPDPLPEDLGCSTEESGLIYGFVFDNQIGIYELSVYWTDVCGAQSNQIDVDWIISDD